ncbi:hypothetical protein UlMin_018216 [Ulmus minor]
MASSDGDQNRSKCCFLKWMKTQEEDLSELLQTLNLNSNNEAELTQLAQKAVKQFQYYIDERYQLACNDVPPFFAPTWCSPWENSLLWIGGCRPSSFFRLIYVLVGLEIESQLTEILQGTLLTGALGKMSSKQLVLVDCLRRKTISEEESLTSMVAGLQEDIADQPVAVIATGLCRLGELTGEVDKVLDEHEKAMVGVLEGADKLRMNTFKELLNVLTPLQAIHFIAASKKLHLCVHEWGNKRDRKHVQ